MLIKIHKTYRNVIAICDSDLIGKKFESQANTNLGKYQLDIKESFYKGEEKTKQEAISIMQNMSREDSTFNIVGEESVNCALEAGIISENGIKKIQEIPFALVLM
ncbi:DUF424 family protein [Candidatus Pacearchaeota archaeon]|nr:DUF424 family protein [Candidatus Pacearchaeota archaeon]